MPFKVLVCAGRPLAVTWMASEPLWAWTTRRLVGSQMMPQPVLASAKSLEWAVTFCAPTVWTSSSAVTTM